MHECLVPTRPGLQTRDYCLVVAMPDYLMDFPLLPPYCTANYYRKELLYRNWQLEAGVFSSMLHIPTGQMHLMLHGQRVNPEVCGERKPIYM